MQEEGLTAEQCAARDQVHDLIQTHADQLGPWSEEDDPVADEVFLDSWCLIASWTDADGSSFLTRIPSCRLPAHTRAGLLHEGLYGFDD
jgi:hypothetical protein